jgi:hypothetical protein
LGAHGIHQGKRNSGQLMVVITQAVVDIGTTFDHVIELYYEKIIEIVSYRICSEFDSNLELKIRQKA